MGNMRLIDRTNGKILASDVELADTFWKRFRGLMLRRRFQRGKALIFKFNKPGRYGIHMFFVRFPIDLVYLDSGFRVVDIRAGLKPWRMYRPKTAARYLVELPAGAIRHVGIRVGHNISLRDKISLREKVISVKKQK